MLEIELYDEEKDIIREALEMYLHAVKGEPYELKKPESEDERHFDEDAVRDVLLRFQ